MHPPEMQACALVQVDVYLDVLSWPAKADHKQGRRCSAISFEKWTPSSGPTRPHTVYARSPSKPRSSSRATPPGQHIRLYWGGSSIQKSLPQYHTKAIGKYVHRLIHHPSWGPPGIPVQMETYVGDPEYHHPLRGQGTWDVHEPVARIATSKRAVNDPLVRSEQ